jgi:molecular chaperone DnaK (HSP70)
MRWFKLLLLKDEDVAPEIRSSVYFLRAQRMLKENQKTAVDVISDYLRCLWHHTIETIEAARGKVLVDALQFRVVITVPAIWKSYARQSMREAANRAGILERRPAGDTELVFAPEPEAAALSTLCEKGRRPRHGDIYVVCDAGGGTVVRFAKERPSLTNDEL